MPKRLSFPTRAWKLDANGDYSNVDRGESTKRTRSRTTRSRCATTTGTPWSIRRVLDRLLLGRSEAGTNFNASFQNTDNNGVIFGLSGYNRQNFRLNLDQQLASNLDASFSAFYGTSSNGRAAEGQTGPFFGLMFLQPDVDILAPNPDGSYKAEVP
jgi:hypothetical protein